MAQTLVADPSWFLRLASVTGRPELGDIREGDWLWVSEGELDA